MSLTRACAFLGCSWLVALAACGGDGGSTDVEPTLRFADRTDTELLRLIDAAGGTDLFRATGMIDQFGDTFEVEPCPTISIAGSVATVTGGCARADGSRLEGSGTVDNPIGWDQLDYEFQNDTLYTFTGFGLTQDQTTQTFDGWLRRSDGLELRDLVINGPDLACTPTGLNACLLGGRFQVSVAYTTVSSAGVGQVMNFNGARAESDQSAFFYFFDNANFEMGVKMVDACSFNDSFWVFLSGLTNQGNAVNILDTFTGQTRTYTNPLGSYPQTLGATDGVTGFDCTPGDGARIEKPTPAQVRQVLGSTPLDPLGDSLVGELAPKAENAATACADDADTACHLGGRFAVEVDWTTVSDSGSAEVMSFGGQRAASDQSSFWWFFDPANFEMGVKMVDACVPPFNAYWVFVSGLTNQGFTVNITDTTTGLSKPYSNPLGQYPQTIGATGADTGFPCD